MRSASDILGRVVRVTLGGQDYALPVRSIRANREWRASLDARTASLLGGLTEAGNDKADIFAVLAGQVDLLIDMLVSYDTSGVLPTREAIEDFEPDASVDVLTAVREVWAASSPLVATALAEMMKTQASDSSAPMSSPASPTAFAPQQSSRMA